MADLKIQNGSYIEVRARSFKGLQTIGAYRSVPVALMALASQAATWQTGDDYLFSATISDMRSAYIICKLDCTRGKQGDYLTMPSGYDPRSDILNAVTSDE